MTPRFVLDSARLAGSPLLRCQTDERLIDLVRVGNDRAFEAIVDRYRRALLRYCSRLLPLSRAEDAVQQTLLNAYSAMHRGDAELDLRPWLYRIARNVCLNALRENGWTHEQIENVRRGAESAHDVVERRQELRDVVAAVHMLPERQREAMVLRELEGRSYDQIGERLDASDGAVRQLLNRARNTLRTGVTALTPIALLSRLGGQPVVSQVSEAAAHDALRGGAGRAAGVAAASLALVAGLTEAPRHLLGGHPGLQAVLEHPDAISRLSALAPRLPLPSASSTLGLFSGLGQAPIARLASIGGGPLARSASLDRALWASVTNFGAPAVTPLAPRSGGDDGERRSRGKGDRGGSRGNAVVWRAAAYGAGGWRARSFSSDGGRASVARSSHPSPKGGGEGGSRGAARIARVVRGSNRGKGPKAGSHNGPASRGKGGGKKSGGKRGRGRG